MANGNGKTWGVYSLRGHVYVLTHSLNGACIWMDGQSLRESAREHTWLTVPGLSRNICCRIRQRRRSEDDGEV